jgi:hypothetical protein
MDAFPEREEVKDLILGFRTTDIGCGIEHQFGVGILGKEGQGTLHGFASSSCPVLLEDGLFSIMRDRVEIEVEHIAYERQKELTDRAIKLAEVGKPKSNWELRRVLGLAVFVLRVLAGK